MGVEIIYLYLRAIIAYIDSLSVEVSPNSLQLSADLKAALLKSENFKPVEN